MSVAHSRIAGALLQVLADLPQRQVAAMVGCDHTTVGRRGPDLHQWPASDLIGLALAIPALRREIQAAIDPSLAQADRLLAEGEARAAVGEMGQVIAQAMARLGDGRLDDRERQATAADLRALAEQLLHHAAVIDARAA